jgi:SagB-type dehydrogenase family enzyme
MDALPIDVVRLPPPDTDGGLPLMAALKRRHSSREFSGKPLPPQVLSNLLWAACGVNRADTRGRTAPSARNWQEIDLYVATRDGLFLYEPQPHGLKRLDTLDVRAASGMQEFVASAPVNLVYVADLSRIEAADDSERRFYTAADAGFIAQNVYLYCASYNLATVVRGLVDRRHFAQLANLKARQRVLLAQTVGYPA